MNLTRFIDDKLVLNNAWDINRNTSIKSSSYTGGYVIFSLEFNYFNF